MVVTHHYTWYLVQAFGILFSDESGIFEIFVRVGFQHTGTVEAKIDSSIEAIIQTKRLAHDVEVRVLCLSARKFPFFSFD